MHHSSQKSNSFPSSRAKKIPPPRFHSQARRIAIQRNSMHHFNKDSDVDFLVNFDKAAITDYFTNFFDLKYALEELLGREVDLLEEQAIRNRYLKENIEQNKTLIYG